MKPIRIEISPGELIDRITILQIKVQRLGDGPARDQVRTELTTLLAARDACVEPVASVQAATAELAAINERLWAVEDELRLCEARQAFGDPFVALARSVYRLNDRRSALKRRLNLLLESSLSEQKVYASQSRDCNTWHDRDSSGR